MASGLVMVVILIGVVTLKTWPHPGDLLGGGGRDASPSSTAASGPQALAQSSGPNLVQPLGAAGPAGRSQRPDRSGTGAGDGLTPGAGGGQPEDAEPPPSESEQPSNAVGQLLSGTGDTVQGATTYLGDTLGGSSSPGLGGVVGAVGSTLNGELQSIARKN
jgi:hypothetical protein